jgi:4-amino-4-deoxy-L-arabinose transferase-like glycosyltransferase
MSQIPSNKPAEARPTARLVLVALVSLGLVVRLMPALARDGSWVITRADSAMYLEIGQSAAAGQGLVQAGAADGITRWAGVTPGYPLFIAAAEMTGYDMRALMAMQALAGTAALVMAFLIARYLAGLWAGIAAAALLVFDPLQVMACTVVLPAAMLSLMLAATAAAGLAALRGLERGSRAAWGWAGAAGAALAGAVYLDPLSGALLPAAGLVAVVVRQRRRLLKAWALALAVLVVALSPWLVRNLILLGRPVLATDVGVRLLESNWPETETPQDEADRLAIYNETVGNDEVRVDHHCWVTAWRQLAAHPGRWLARFGERAGTFWSPESTVRLWPALPRITGYTSLIPVAVLALGGMVVLAWRRRGALAWLLLAPAAMMLAHAVVGGGPQDRIAVMPILAALGGVGLAQGLGRGRPALADKPPAAPVY